ncbi:hypothetical protein PQQ86_13835 [Paraburkholderia sediminicola]|uniref:hypothetical protein n=1 Tax=Paraburkholderia sediminicola TaxID=458836 RepID=UPI0038BD8994
MLLRSPSPVLVLVDATGQAAPLVSVLAALPRGNAQAIANVTALTTAIAALLTSSGNPLDLSTPATLVSLSLAAVQAAVAKLNT